MAVRKLKPTTPGQRHKIIGAFDTITASAPEKSLVFGKTKTGGRNHQGKAVFFPFPKDTSTFGAIIEKVPIPINIIANVKIIISFLYLNRIYCAILSQKRIYFLNHSITTVPFSLS